MSVNSDPTSGCIGKTKYRVFRRAELAAARSAKASEEPMHAYKCRRCNRFHVGSHLQRKKPKPAAEEVRDE